MTHMNVHKENRYAASKLESLHALILMERLEFLLALAKAERRDFEVEKDKVWERRGLLNPYERD